MGTSPTLRAGKARQREKRRARSVQTSATRLSPPALLASPDDRSSVQYAQVEYSSEQRKLLSDLINGKEEGEERRKTSFPHVSDCSLRDSPGEGRFGCP